MGNHLCARLHWDWLLRRVPGIRFCQPVGTGRVGGRAVLAQARAGVAHRVASLPRQILTIEQERLGEYNQHRHWGFASNHVYSWTSEVSSQRTMHRARGILGASREHSKNVCVCVPLRNG